MTRRTILFVLFAIAAAAGCIRLGFWQLSRLDQRRRRNVLEAAQLAQPPTTLTRLPADSSSRLRRAQVTGSPDYAHELILATRSYEGSPGVNILTPVHILGRDTAVLVNRGWVYAPDGVRVDLTRWRERDSTFTGYAEIVAADGTASAAEVLRDNPRVLRRLNAAAVVRALPYPVSPLYLVATVVDSSTRVEQRVARLPPPALDEGPHLSYALQWFAFAAIALVGATAVVMRTRPT